MSLINSLVVRLQRHPKRVVFPEGLDSRILQAAHEFASNKLAVPFLVGYKNKIKTTAEQLDISMEKMRGIAPRRNSDWDEFIRKCLQRFRNMNDREAKDYFATFMLATSQVATVIRS